MESNLETNKKHLGRGSFANLLQIKVPLSLSAHLNAIGPRPFCCDSQTSLRAVKKCLIDKPLSVY